MHPHIVITNHTGIASSRSLIRPNRIPLTCVLVVETSYLHNNHRKTSETIMDKVLGGIYEKLHGHVRGGLFLVSH